VQTLANVFYIQFKLKLAALELRKFLIEIAEVYTFVYKYINI